MNADNLTDDEMIVIAKDLGFSESAFVQKSEKADYKVRFFSSTQEVDLCGYATLATFHVLVTNKLITFRNSQPVQKPKKQGQEFFPLHATQMV